MKAKMQYCMAQHATTTEDNTPGVQVQLQGPTGQLLMFVDHATASRMTIGEEYEIELHIGETH